MIRLKEIEEEYPAQFDALMERLEKNRKEVSKHLKRVAVRYGKIGLVIDDSNDAASRIAREFYGCDRIPEWWMVAQSQLCAFVGLLIFYALFCEARRDPSLSTLRGILIVDRFLPEYCDRGQIRAWDETPDENEYLRPRLAWIISRLYSRRNKSLSARRGAEEESAGGDYIMALATNNPHSHRFGSLGGHAMAVGDGCFRSQPECERLEWQSKNFEIFQGLRQRVLNLGGTWRGLLDFGPEPDAPILSWENLDGKGLFNAGLLEDSGETGFFNPDEIEEGKRTASSWKRNISRIAESLRQSPRRGAGKPDSHIVVIVGSDCSEKYNAYSPGLPAGPWDDAGERDREPTDPLDPDPVLRRHCLCTSGVGKQHSDIESHYSKSGIAREQSGEHTMASLRRLLYRYDREFAYHHWLMAQLPFSPPQQNLWVDFGSGRLPRAWYKAASRVS